MDRLLDKWRSYKLPILGLGLALLLGIGFVVLKPQNQNQEPDLLTLASQVTKDTPKEEEKGEAASPEREAVIMVDVKGAVHKPGLYELSEYARVADAIALAGGQTAEADPKSINLAQKLTDEAVVYVATREEGVSVLSSPVAASSGYQSQSSSGLVNLNTATASDLQTISGIGAKRAQDIISYREANGGFKSIDDLNQVSGIGDKTLESIRPYVTVD